jgi:serine/threonine protein kinase
MIPMKFLRKLFKKKSKSKSESKSDNKIERSRTLVNKLSITLGNEAALADFEIREKIGSGSFADVFAGVHIPTQREVALKILKHDPTASAEHERSSFLIESNIGLHIQHKVALLSRISPFFRFFPSCQSYEPACMFVC